jgi:hypothetical protein
MTYRGLFSLVTSHSSMGLRARSRSRANHPIGPMGQPTPSRSPKGLEDLATHHHRHRPFFSAEHPTREAAARISSRRVARRSGRRSRPLAVRPASASGHVPAVRLTVVAGRRAAAAQASRRPLPAALPNDREADGDGLARRTVNRGDRPQPVGSRAELAAIHPVAEMEGVAGLHVPGAPLVLAALPGTCPALRCNRVIRGATALKACQAANPTSRTPAPPSSATANPLRRPSCVSGWSARP